MVRDLPPDALQGGNAAVGADGAEGAHGPAGKALHGAEHVPVRLLGRIHQAIRRSGAPTYAQMSATKTIICFPHVAGLDRVILGTYRIGLAEF